MPSETKVRPEAAGPDVAVAGGVREPVIVAFFCNWCTYTAADMAGLSRMVYSPAVRVVRLMCSGRLDPQFVLAAFRQGADGVLIGGCHPGDCHYQEGNYKALRRVVLLRSMLAQFGIEDERLRLEWISASEGEKVQRVCNEMAEDLRRLGPLRVSLPEAGPEELDLLAVGHNGAPAVAASHADGPAERPVDVPVDREVP